MRTILCYGDSNTWGYDPRGGERFDRKSRWPMVLQELLNKEAGEEWLVVEEGLSGRTSCREDPIEGDRNGLRQLLPILESHAPIDIVAVMLGTNDLKLRFNPQAFDIAAGAQHVAMAAMASQTGPGKSSPKALIICPPPVVESPVFAHIFGDCVELSKKLPPLYRQLAGECGAAFLDAGLFIKTSPVDGIHFEIEEHRKLAAAIAGKIRQLFIACPRHFGKTREAGAV